MTADGDCSHEIKRCLQLGRKAVTNHDSILKSKDVTLLTKVQLVKAMVFPVVMYECESWIIKKAEHWRTDVFKLGQQGDQPVNRKGNQPHLLFRMTDAEAESPILWPPNVISWLTGKDSDAWKYWRQKIKRVTENEIVDWHHRFNGHELGQILGDGKWQGSLACCSLGITKSQT